MPIPSRTLRHRLLVLLLLGLAGAALVFWPRSEPSSLTAPVHSSSAVALAAPSSLGAEVTAPLAAASSTLAAPPVQSAAVMAGQEPTEMLSFRLDAQGRLVQDERTRLDLEKLFVLNEAAERARKLGLLVASLPADAARELGELASRYGNYQDAMHAQLPPGQEVTTRAEAQAQFDRLRSLREQYFGAPLAARLFGAEEALVQAQVQELPVVLQKD